MKELAIHTTYYADHFSWMFVEFNSNIWIWMHPY
jgi:hypothetical protein